MYEALYRKYRPRDFDEVVGQEHITETLKVQVRTGRLSHAYLFIGTRGTGKTTCARILAKAVNCEHPVDGNPCNRCANCRAFDGGELLDVTELDAASNNGVDDVRILRDEAVFSPARAKKRVYIIDEVHMLSKSAFNALLKILEEPPEHLMFILATTELNKVLPTILSRCQRHNFRRLDAETIAGRLLYVAGQEHIALTDDAAALLGRLADGGMRDGLSLLDQCASRDPVDVDTVLTAMGLGGSYATARLAGMVERHDVQSALLHFRSLWQEGKDPASLLGELCNFYRDALMLRLAPRGGESLLSGLYGEDVLGGVALGSGELLEMLNIVQKYQSGMKDAPNVRLQCELCLVELCTVTPAGSLREVPPAPPAEESPAPAREEEKSAPARREAPPVEEDPWESALPVQDAPPWEDVPPPPEDPWEEAAPVRDEPPREERFETEPPAPAAEDPWEEAVPVDREEPPAPGPAEEGEHESWQSLLPRLEAALPMHIFMFLSDDFAIQPRWEKGELVIAAQPGFYFDALNHADILESIARVAGCPARLTELSAAPAERGNRKLDVLEKFTNVLFK